MKPTKHLLQQLTELLPPPIGQRHSVTFDGERLVLALRLETGQELFTLDDSDLGRSVDDLIGEITISRRVL